MRHFSKKWSWKRCEHGVLLKTDRCGKIAFGTCSVDQKVTVWLRYDTYQSYQILYYLCIFIFQISFCSFSCCWHFPFRAFSCTCHAWFISRLTSKLWLCFILPNRLGYKAEILGIRTSWIRAVFTNYLKSKIIFKMVAERVKNFELWISTRDLL